MKVELNLRNGPMAGRRQTVDLRRKEGRKIVLGRDPGPSGLVLEGDTTVSRLHGELRAGDGTLQYRNLSANGSSVDGSRVMGDITLDAESRVRIGSHEIEICHQPAVPRHSSARATEQTPLFESGPLARPAVRILLGVYFVAVFVLTIFLAGWETGPVEGYDEARKAYVQAYLPTLEVAASERDRRIARADRLAAELAAQIQGERWGLARSTCRSLMALDSDVDSPIYRFAARHLDRLAERS